MMAKQAVERESEEGNWSGFAISRLDYHRERGFRWKNINYTTGSGGIMHTIKR